MPDKYGFNILVDWGQVTVKCIEEDCDAGGILSTWTEERKKVHFLTHNYRMEGESPKIDGEKRIDKCRICGREFEQAIKRGRPRVKCYVCQPAS